MFCHIGSWFSLTITVGLLREILIRWPSGYVGGRALQCFDQWQYLVRVVDSMPCLSRSIFLTTVGNWSRLRWTFWHNAIEIFLCDSPFIKRLLRRIFSFAKIASVGWGILERRRSCTSTVTVGKHSHGITWHKYKSVVFCYISHSGYSPKMTIGETHFVRTVIM